MMEADLQPAGWAAADALAGGGRMGALVRGHDWATTPIGEPETWPQSLRTAVSICLASRFPMLIWWGDRLIQIYNDGYRPVLGAKHPRSLGQSGDECWAEVWDVLGPLYRHVRATGESTWSEDLLLEMDRYGFPEETYFTFSYSAIRDESGGVGGVLVTCVETTERVLGERRLSALRELAARAAEARTVADACHLASRVIDGYRHDIPFASIFLAQDEGAVCAATAGEAPAALAASAKWPVEDSLRTGSAILVSDVRGRIGDMAGAPWDRPIDAALILPIAQPGHVRPAGALVAGISPALRLNDAYRAFLDLVASHIATAIADATAHEAERRRVEALAELDRAKTQFFANVSHEFRTPLTLMLGPIDELLQSEQSGQRRASLELLQRNARRLQKLVNTLLDFSRIEADRHTAAFRPTDVASLTAELASAFRSAVESAGLRLIIDAPPLPEPIWVDREMWEKIVLNLVSNAYKHTFAGEIEVRVQWCGDHIELTVRDTGVGIPEDHVPLIFDRFHRVRDARSRTHEGTGIGLSLVRQLVNLHGGTIDLESEVDVGTRVIVRIPTGNRHLPAERVSDEPAPDSAADVRPFVDEIFHWNSTDRTDAIPRGEPGRPRVLVVDDNADMRAYITRLLREQWEVSAAADGSTALDAIRREPPDLVLTDVMMPGLDGFQLLRELRADPATRELPIVLLSARAGEEARVEGLTAGADDYLVKPFGARELIARVGAAIELSRIRAHAADVEREARAAAEEAVHAREVFLATMSHELRTPLNAILGFSDLLDAEIAGPLTDGQRAHLSKIRASARHLTRIIEEILTFSRLEAGEEEPEPEPVNLAALVRETTALMEPLADVRRLRLEVRTDDLAEPFTTDPRKVRQILLNLLSNAIKFTDEGGVEVSALRTPGGARIDVRDTGPGIVQSEQSRIFEPFLRAQPKGRVPTSGTGLGLPVSRQLARLLGGDVVLHSAPGEGATFSVHLRDLAASP